jgi:hypothetical protein
MTEPFHKRQPILVGCLGCLSLSMVVAFGLILFMGLRMKSCVETVSQQLGFDSGIFMKTMAAGFSVQINVAAGTGELRMIPTSPRKVTCDDLQTIVFPHLTGTLATVIITSESHEPGPDGRVLPVPLTCRWSGFPTKDTPLGSAGPTMPPPPVDSPAEEPQEPDETEPSPAPADPSGD